MGSVAMERSHTVIYKGIPLGGSWDCLYCDKCGSFDIGKRLTLRAIMWISIAGIVAVVFGMAADTNALFAVIFCFVIQLWVLSILKAFTVSYRCRKCGNKDITFDNMLNYPEYDKRILDIPYEKTLTIFTDEGSGY